MRNDFKIDFPKTWEQYGGKEITVVVTLNPDDPYLNEIRTCKTFNYSDKKGYKGLPIIETDPGLRISTDLKLFQDNPDSLQGYIQMVNGKTQGYLDELYTGDNKFYLIYDKKHNSILTLDFSELISLYVRMINNPNQNQNDINNW